MGLEAVLLEHGCDRAQVGLGLGLLLELLGSLLLHVVRLGLDLALGLGTRDHASWRKEATTQIVRGVRSHDRAGTRLLRR